MARLQIIVSRPDGHPTSARVIVTRQLDGLSIDTVAQIARALNDHIDDEVKALDEARCTCGAAIAQDEASSKLNCRAHGIGASNARQSDFLSRQSD